ncbi:hypothetical protein CUMW_207470 [Citrus unshiu]|uniref:C2H2-type domain-containing protein n=1 Tax=Citrus unshiu TaxID=55188 RepID=A0A2H5Q9C2_CITUN|nr:hypothetical protein CUMW_207470 [Citrus unshiu]
MQAFSLDFNLRSHMKTHSQENYPTSANTDLWKSGDMSEYKLKNIQSHTKELLQGRCPDTLLLREDNNKLPSHLLGFMVLHHLERPYACPLEGCEKAYIHEYNA